MSYTEDDMTNAMAYANQRLKLIYLKHLYGTHPHIASHVKYRVTRADPELDYYFPSAFDRRAVKTEMSVDSVLCEKLSCNNVKLDGLCDRAEEASYYRVGDQEVFERVCQPACYGLLQHGNEKPQMPRLHYNRGRCAIVPPAVTWLEAPLYRSGERYEKRVNDLPVGFNRGPVDPNTVTGLTYDYNKTYCDAFFDNWDPVAKDCYYPWHLVLLHAVVGESVVKLVRAGVTYAESGRKSDIPRPDLPPVPLIENVWSKEAWLSDVNADFVPPDVDVSLESGVATAESGDNVVRDILRKARASTALNIDQRRRLEETAVTRHRRSIVDGETIVHVAQIVKEAVLNVMESFTTTDFWQNLGINVLSEAVLLRLKELATNAATRLVPRLMELLAAESSTELLTNVLSKSVSVVTANAIGKLAVKVMGQTVIGICKTLAQLVSVVGVVLAIVNVFDIILSFWDPLNFNKKYDKEVLTQLMEQSEFALREDFKTSTPVMTFDLLCTLLIDQERMIELNLSAFAYVYEYLDSLTVNSRGVRIYKGGPVDCARHSDEIVVNTRLYTPDQMYRHERDHANRMRYFAAIRPYAVGATAVASLFLVAGAHFAGLLFALVAVLLVFSLYYNAWSPTNLNVYLEQVLN